jgi:tRNA/tmRNA/rRNA uracil-C5-methylase (TrmA/RlmC/RlmD family)
MDEIGFQRSSNRNLVDVPECPIATPEINAKYKEVRERLHEQAKIGELNKPKTKKKLFRSTTLPMSKPR